MNIFSNHPERLRNQQKGEGAKTHGFAEQLAADASRRRSSAPPGLHDRVMRAVATQRMTDKSARRYVPGWALGLLPGAIAAVALFLLTIHVPFNPREEATADGDPTSLPGSFLTLADYLDAQRAEAPIHDVAADLLLKEFENLSQDARSAGEFVWSTTKGRVSADWIVP